MMSRSLALITLSQVSLLLRTKQMKMYYEIEAKEKWEQPKNKNNLRIKNKN